MLSEFLTSLKQNINWEPPSNVTRDRGQICVYTKGSTTSQMIRLLHNYIDRVYCSFCAEMMSFKAKMKRCDAHPKTISPNKFATDLFVEQLAPTNATILSVAFWKLLRTNSITKYTLLQIEFFSFCNGENASKTEVNSNSVCERNVTYIDRMCVSDVLHPFIFTKRSNAKG